MDKNTALAALGYKPTQSGGRYAVGADNGRGGVSMVFFTMERGNNLVNRLAESGFESALRKSGSPHKFVVVFN